MEDDNRTGDHEDDKVRSLMKQEEFLKKQIQHLKKNEVRQD